MLYILRVYPTKPELLTPSSLLTPLHTTHLKSVSSKPTRVYINNKPSNSSVPKPRKQGLLTCQFARLSVWVRNLVSPTTRNMSNMSVVWG